MPISGHGDHHHDVDDGHRLDAAQKKDSVADTFMSLASGAVDASYQCK